MKAEIRDYEKLTYICEPAFDEKTGVLAWCARSFEDGRYTAKIYLKQVSAATVSPEADDTVKTVTAGCKEESLPGFSPDGSRLSFLSGDKDAKKLVLCDRMKEQNVWELPGQEGKEAVEYAWNRDGNLLAWIGAERIPGEAVPETWKAPIVAEGGSYRRESDGGWKTERKYTLNLYDFAKNESRCLYESAGEVQKLSWSEDGKRLCFWDEKRDYSAVSVEAAETEPVCFSSKIQEVISSLKPDGTGKLPAKWQGDCPDEVLPDVINGSPFEEKNRQICKIGKEGTWAVIGCKAGRTAVYLLTFAEETPAGTEKTEKETGADICGTWRRLTDGTGTYFAVCEGESGFLYGVRSDWNHPAELVRISLEDGSWTVVCNQNRWAQKKTFAGTQAYQCSSLDGAAVLDGWVMKPAGSTDEKIPAVLLVHGGPLSAYADAFTMEAQLLCAAGFGVILANPRGSSGYGKEYGDYEKAFDGTAANDLLYYMDCVLRRFDWIDAERLGVAGGSYGGYMSAWLAGNCRRFKAAVVMRGLLNFEFLYLTSQAAGEPGMLDEPRDFEDFLMKMVEESPVIHAQNMNIPMLIMHGEQDVNCPVDGAHQLYVAVKDTHPELPVKLILFPDTGHNIRSARLDYYKRYEQELIDWLKKYV